MTKIIKAQRGNALVDVLVDDGDFNRLSKYVWFINSEGRAVTKFGNKYQAMHLMIMPSLDDMQIDHRDKNPLNNQRSNFRYCSQSQNVFNTGRRKDNTTGYKGVRYHKYRNWYYSVITVNKKVMHLGYYTTAEDAARAYDNAVVKYMPEYGYLNFPEEWEGGKRIVPIDIQSKRVSHGCGRVIYWISTSAATFALITNDDYIIVETAYYGKRWMGMDIRDVYQELKHNVSLDITSFCVVTYK